MTISKKKGDNVVKLDASYSKSLQEVIEFNSKLLTEILNRLEIMNKKLNKAILLERKLKNLQEEVATFESIYVQDHTSDDDTQEEEPSEEEKPTFWN